ncbi:hypothetical protein PT974_07284 [Cladobotryum mycophilum]|uniref:Zn(2)-C6 fungal-type domain-containing protein n=1 Tax=Cladobotryum mycophilum TaxID=491253 RepID=A0ABR0SNX5_9HYPO
MNLDSNTPPPPAVHDKSPTAQSHAQPQSQARALSQQGESSQALDRRPKKSSSTCSVCRFRKVRCNGIRPSCYNCQRLGFPCSYDDVDIESWSAALPRRRVKQACVNCHSRKARCSGHIPICERCRSQGLDCVYRPSKRSKGPVSGSAEGKSPISQEGELDRPWSKGKEPVRTMERDDGRQDSPESTDLTSAASPSLTNPEGPYSEESFDAVIGRTFDNFFRHVHHIPMYSFLHRASLMEQYRSGKVDRALLLALIGITSCLTDMGESMRQYGDRCIDEAEGLLFADYARPSTIKVQALVFVIKHRILSNKFSNAFVLISLASRYAAALRLNYEAPNICFLAQESRRRLMWSLYCIDSTAAAGHRDFSIWRAEMIHVSLPCNERNFEFDLPQQTEKLLPASGDPRRSQADDIGSLALHIRILYIRQKIAEFTKTAYIDHGINAGDIQNEMLVLSTELDDFANQLPVSFQFSENSLRLRAYSPRICPFVMIHVWWHQCYCDLYRLALAGLRGSLPQDALEMFDDGFIDHCQRQCLDHSMAMANIFAAMQRLNARPVADLDFAMCSYQCARMLRYSYLRNGTKWFNLTANTVINMAAICLQTIKNCCMGLAAASIRRDLETLISQGFTNESSPSHIESPEAARLAGHGLGNMSQHAFLRNMDVTEEPELLSAHRPANLQPFTPTTPSTMGSVSSFAHSVISGPWAPASASNFSQDITQTLSDVHTVQRKSATPDVPHQRPDFMSPEMNNAYEGTMDEFGLDTGLEGIIGIDLNMWGPGGAGWPGQDPMTGWGGM